LKNSPRNRDVRPKSEINKNANEGANDKK